MRSRFAYSSPTCVPGFFDADDAQICRETRENRANVMNILLKGCSVTGELEASHHTDHMNNSDGHSNAFLLNGSQILELLRYLTRVHVVESIEFLAIPIGGRNTTIADCVVLMDELHTHRLALAVGTR